jgi:uncharacterized protein
MNAPGVAVEPATPVAPAERIELMDVLRGVALFGVFLMNFTVFARTGMMSTEQQMLSLPSAPLDHSLSQVFAWLALDKANTLFAFLFGLGFYLQMRRLEARGVDFVPLYFRRMTVLLIFGVLHVVFVWTWDILHLYALAGLILVAFRELSNRALIFGGILCAAFTRTVQEAFSEFGPASTWTGAPDPFADAAVLERQQLAHSGDYLGLVGNFLDLTVVDYLLSGMILGWLCYVLGRFFFGVWVGRHEWITRARDFLPGWRRVVRWALPGGLILEGIAVLIGDSPLLPEYAHREFFGDALHLVSVPVLAAGYVAAVVVGFHAPIGRRLLKPFAAAGRMALTNYVAQSFVMGFVLFGVGPGLALAGRIGTAAITGIVVGCYAAQILASRLWLSYFHYGPLEWLWRALTYGTLPRLRLRVNPG